MAAERSADDAKGQHRGNARPYISAKTEVAVTAWVRWMNAQKNPLRTAVSRRKTATDRHGESAAMANRYGHRGGCQYAGNLQPVSSNTCSDESWALRPNSV